MSSAIITTLLATAGSILLAGASYWFTKQREREAEWRKEKLAHYKAFVAALSGAISGETTPDGQRAFARACNDLNLVAPQKVIEALREFHKEIKTSNINKNQDNHDQLLAALFYEIRRDLKIHPKDKSNTFNVGLFSSGVKQNKDR